MNLKFNLKRAVVGGAAGCAVGVPMAAVQTVACIWGVFNAWWYVPAVYTVGGTVMACDQDVFPNKEVSRG
ncbi:MAG: hypothetical protein ACXADS_14495 [Candidatus Thorarchaeota archaeon]|jgi:hypothetical protein